MGSIYACTVASGKRAYRISYRRPDGSQATLRGFRRKYDAAIRVAEVEVSKNRLTLVDPADPFGDDLDAPSAH